MHQLPQVVNLFGSSPKNSLLAIRKAQRGRDKKASEK
jgi:hypothetical protein